MNDPIYDKSLNYRMFKKICKIIVTTFLYSLFLLTAHATTLYGEHVNSIVYGKHYEKKLQGRWHVYMNGKPVLDKHGKPITYGSNAQPGSKGFNYNLKGSSAEQNMFVGNWWVFILNLLLCLSCSQKKANTVRDYAKDSGTQGWYLINPIYINGNSFYNKERKKIKINEIDLLNIDAIVKKQLAKLNDAMPFEYYYRQYIGYMENGNIYI